MWYFCYYKIKGLKFEKKMIYKGNRIEERRIIKMNGRKMEKENMEVRRRKIMFREWNRGMREMDMIMGKYEDKYIVSLKEDKINEFENIMEVMESEIMKWVKGERKIKDE